jgi:hypothetical protein
MEPVDCVIVIERLCNGVCITHGEPIRRQVDMN